MLHFMIIQYDASDTDVTYIKLASGQVEFLPMAMVQCTIYMYDGIYSEIFQWYSKVKARVRNHEKIRARIRARKKSCTISRFVHDIKNKARNRASKNRARFF